MYVKSGKMEKSTRAERLYHYTARREIREMERTPRNEQNGESEDFYLKGGEQLDFS